MYIREYRGVKNRVNVLVKTHVCAIGFLLVLALAACESEDSDSTIVTEEGSINGITSPEINQYLGIPYAAPPVGELRWKPPEPHDRWDGVFKAAQFGSPCPQRTAMGYGSFIGNEDCLFLNVYTPGENRNDKTEKGLPVMVWIHGGALLFGAGSEYDPTPLVTKGDVIVVTLNYRLGFLGWFAHAALDAEGHRKANYGLMDQQLALQWVKRNIAAFGGDPDRVTIFGESAGGLSVYCNLASPTAAGLFQRAIAESGAYAGLVTYPQFIVPLTDAEANGTAFAAKVGCPQQTADCLRAIAASDLVAAQPSETNSVNPMVDGEVLTQTPGEAFAGGNFNKAPVISGSNHDEWRFFSAAFYDWAGAPMKDTDYRSAVAALLKAPDPDPSGVLNMFLNLYPLSNYPPSPGGQSAPLAYGALGTDAAFACPGWNAAEALSQHVPVYAYEFNDPAAPLWPGLPPPSFPMGAYHTSELLYLMYMGNPAEPVSFTKDQQALSDAMIGYWTQFAKTGDPNFAGAPTWLSYAGDNGRLQTLKPPAPETTPMADFYQYHHCAIWLTPPP